MDGLIFESLVALKEWFLSGTINAQKLSHEMHSVSVCVQILALFEMKFLPHLWVLAKP